jgi:hypothetical protein
MKSVKTLVVLLSVAMLVFYSCKKSAPPHLAAIPAEALFVISLENKQLVNKGGLNNLAEFKLFEKLKAQIADENAATQSFFNKVILGPNETGLDVERSYIYGASLADDFYTAVVFKMADAAAFEAIVKELAQAKNGALPEWQDKGTYKILHEKNVALTWNSEFFILYAGEESLENLNFEEFFTLPQEKSILSVADFAQFRQSSSDVGFWAAYGSFLKLCTKLSGKRTANLLSSLPEEYSDMYAHAYLNFENGEIKASFKMTPKEKVEALYAKYPIIKRDFNDQLLGDFSDNSYLAFKLSVDVLEYLKIMKSMGTDNMIDELMLADPTFNTVLNALAGDFLFSLYGFAQGPLPIPLAGLGFTVKRQEDFDKLLALVPSRMVTAKDDHYVIATGVMISLYVACKDNRVFVSDDADGLAAFLNKGNSKNLASGPLGESLKKSSSLFYVNLDFDSYPENIRSLAKSGLGGDISTVLSFLSPYKDLTVSATEDYEGIFILRFKEKENALKQVLKGIDSFADSKSK